MSEVTVIETPPASEVEVPATQAEVIEAEAVETAVETALEIAKVEAKAEVAIAETNAEVAIAAIEAESERVENAQELKDRMTWLENELANTRELQAEMVESLTLIMDRLPPPASQEPEAVETVETVTTIENPEAVTISSETPMEVSDEIRTEPHVESVEEKPRRKHRFL